MRIRLLLASALGAAVLIPASAGASPVYFLQGEQAVPVQRPGTTLQAAMTALLRGPTGTEKSRRILTYLPAGTPLRSATVAGGVATVDLGSRMVQGTAPDVLQARLTQVVETATAVPGVNSVQVLVEGGVPLGLFPGIDASGPLTPKALATPTVAPPRPAPARPGPVSPGVRGAQERLAALGYLPQSGIDGQAGPATTVGVIAFQKWQGLPRDGQLGPQTLAALNTAQRPTPITQGGPGVRVEVLIDRQLVLAIRDNQVVRAVHVSTGKPSTPTPIGSFKVYEHLANGGRRRSRSGCSGPRRSSAAWRCTSTPTSRCSRRRTAACG